jgi:hypothetical protein
MNFAKTREQDLICVCKMRSGWKKETALCCEGMGIWKLRELVVGGMGIWKLRELVVGCLENGDVFCVGG